MVENCKHVRVDNWGIFFLQRLQLFFSKTDYCDLTLQFEGNVQLKVHRLVVNACTEFFQVLESCQSPDESVLIMPKELQADVIVPIVNFMYTGTLQFQMSLLDKLYKAAETMNITVLTKLLDAQKQQKPASGGKKVSPNAAPIRKVMNSKSESGTKLPIWKRKKPPQSTSFSAFSNQHIDLSHNFKETSNEERISLSDNTPKPTRFECDDEELSSLGFMDNSFENISYTSKPLLTQEYESKAGPSFDDIRQSSASYNKHSYSNRKENVNESEINIDEVQDYVKEQRIRSGLTQQNFDDDDEVKGTKRKSGELKVKVASKKVRFEEKQDIDHQKIISEILKKYPQLVKKNKNIRLKIMAKGAGNKGVKETPAKGLKTVKFTNTKSEASKTTIRDPLLNENKSDRIWMCNKCSTPDEPVEFMLYYLYRKHMSDIHEEKFDDLLCKYCGHKCTKHNLLMYHLYTKHGLKPPSAYVFPKCNLCPYIALNDQILNRHKAKHGKNEKMCVECCLAFTTKLTLMSHVQITGHNGRTGKFNFDCQYCTKRYQSGVNLFSHIRIQHRNEARCDGIVSIDEPEEFDEAGQQIDFKQEYFVSEMGTSMLPLTKDKVKILSDIKVSQEPSTTRQQHIKLEPSSEAEALSNVASGIATSLGLVDIVVLNENQQYILQSDQSSIVTTPQNEGEFLLPEMHDSNKFTHHQVSNEHSVLSQGMMPTGDIGSTDELVMVLTDHDYGDGQNEISADNSNIVVLYSHPVDGQQGQFITSQNLTVNSQTGMIEIRNGAITTTASSNQLVMTDSVDSPIESIELIQQEVDGHRASLKPPESTLYVSDKLEEQTQLLQEPPVSSSHEMDMKLEKEMVIPDNSSLDNVPPEGDFELMETVDLNDQNKSDTAATAAQEENSNTVEEPQESIVDNIVENSENEPESIVDSNVENNENEPEKLVTSVDETDCSSKSKSSEVFEEEPMEVDEEIENPAQKESEYVIPLESDTQSPQKLQDDTEILQPINEEEQEGGSSSQNQKEEMPVLTSELDNKNEDDGQDVPPETLVERSPPRLEIQETEDRRDETEDHQEATEDHQETAEDHQEMTEDHQETTEDHQEKTKPEPENSANEEQDEEKQDSTEQTFTEEYEVEPMEVDGRIQSNGENFDEVDKAPEDSNAQIQENSEETNCNLEESNAVKECEPETDDKVPETEAPSAEQIDDSQLTVSETSASHDDNSQFSQMSSEQVSKAENSEQESNPATKISILDDWDDTDSQQSGEAEVIKAAGETVNKLMDDWEEEDDADE